MTQMWVKVCLGIGVVFYGGLRTGLFGRNIYHFGIYQNNEKKIYYQNLEIVLFVGKKAD